MTVRRKERSGKGITTSRHDELANKVIYLHCTTINLFISPDGICDLVGISFTNNNSIIIVTVCGKAQLAVGSISCISRVTLICKNCETTAATTS